MKQKKNSTTVDHRIPIFTATHTGTLTKEFLKDWTSTGTWFPVSPTSPSYCKRCLRTDLPLRTNGLCDRCDHALYGVKE